MEGEEVNIGSGGTPGGGIATATTPEVQVGQGMVNLPDPEAQARIAAQLLAQPSVSAPSPEAVQLELVRQQYADTQRQLQEYQAREEQWRVEQTVAQEVADYQRHWETQGLAPEVAKQVASTYHQQRTAYATLQSRAVLAMQGFKGNIEAGIQSAVKSGLLAPGHAELLSDILSTALQHRDPMTARQTFDRSLNDRARFRKMEAELAELKRGKVPAQTFDSGIGGGGMTNKSLEALLQVDISRMTQSELAEYNKQWSAALRQGR